MVALAQTPEKSARHRSFLKNIALMTSAIVLLLVFVFIAFSRVHLKKLFEEEYNYRVLNINRMIAAQVDGDRIQDYTTTQEKDAYYFEMLDTLFLMQEIFEVEFLYIVSEDPETGELVYVFDAVLDWDTMLYDDSSFCKVIDDDDFPGSIELLKTGVGFETARYYEGDYGYLYYAYTPIFNSKGAVVAFLGTDVDAAPMLDTIRRFELRVFVVSILLTAAIIFLSILYAKRKFADPILRLTDDIVSLSQGNLKVPFSDTLLQRRDELGLIYNAFYGVNQTVTNLIRDMNIIASEVVRGNLSIRLEQSEDYLGDFALLRKNANRMLDNFCKVLDMMPNTVVLYDHEFLELYRNHSQNDDHHLLAALETLEDNQQELEQLRQGFLMTRGGSFATTFSLTDSEGAHHHYDAFLIHIGSTMDSGKCAVFTDVTEYLEMSERAEASNRAKSEFLSRMSHEIRTPLNAIVGMTEIVQRSNHDPVISKHLETIEKSAEHLLTIINDVLDISKIEAGNMELSFSDFSLTAMMEDVVRILDGQARERDISLVLDMPDLIANPIFVTGDEVRLRQVVINLISNAIKFSPSSDQVFIHLRFESRSSNSCSVRFSVKDFGIGIEKENQKAIFEAFEQGGNHIAKEYGGTGLGLPISNKILHLMGSSGIFVNSHPGQGSEFYFSLSFQCASPPTTLESLQNPPERHEDMNLSGYRFLLVDDIPVNREIVLALMEDSGVAIDEADDGTTAVQKFTESPLHYYDLILMDIQMRQMDGYQATREIRSSNRVDCHAVKIVAMSANAFQEDMEKAQKCGMDGYITKPIHYPDMMRTIETILMGGDGNAKKETGSSGDDPTSIAAFE